MKLHNIKTAHGLANTLYGVDLSESTFEEMALVAWELIGTKHTRLYKYVGDTENKTLVLPCNVDVIESVHLPILDAQVSSNQMDFVDVDAIQVENYIETSSKFEDPYYNRGKFAKYDLGDGELYFKRDYKNITVIYHGVISDDEGLPMINEKEMKAIAAYVAYAYFYKDGLKRRDAGAIQLAGVLKQDWLRYCNAARIPDHLSQNDMDAILDAKVCWNRKKFGASLKPIR